MAAPPAFPDRFDFGRLLADTGRVLARQWLLLVIGVIVLAGLPVAASDVPWWRGSPDTPAATFHRVWLEINLAKAFVKIVAYSAKTVFVVAVSTKVLASEPWRHILRPRRWLAGLLMALFIELIVNWALLLAPFATLSRHGWGWRSRPPSPSRSRSGRLWREARGCSVACVGVWSVSASPTYLCWRWWITARSCCSESPTFPSASKGLAWR
jgi:hypothetical protein